MRLVIARCSVDYVGRLEAHLPEATRLIMIKRDDSVSIHADDRAYKPLNWMTPPCTLTSYEEAGELAELEDESVQQLWVVTNPKGEQLRIRVYEIYADHDHDLGEGQAWLKMAWKLTCRSCWRIRLKSSARIHPHQARVPYTHWLSGYPFPRCEWHHSGC